MLSTFRYWLTYYLAYKFSGAHEKPTSDSEYDPKIANCKHFLTKALRKLETSYYSELKHQQPSNLQLPEIDASDLNPELFRLISQNKTHSIVIRGLIKNTSAVKNWNSDYFEDNYGDTQLLTLRQPDDGYVGAYTSFNEAVDFRKISLKDSIQTMKTDSEKLYINNITEIFHNHPELVDELELNSLVTAEPKITPETWLKINMFMGGLGTGSSLHCAVASNFFFNVHGKKKWVLIHPKYSKYLKSMPSKGFEFAISGYNIEEPSEILEKIPKYEVILEPGDVLYNAPWFWHYVKNITDFTIGCAIRDHTTYQQSFKNNPMFMWMSPYPTYLNPWLLKVVNWIKGRGYLLNRSLKSEHDIVNNLTNYQIPTDKIVGTNNGKTQK